MHKTSATSTANDLNGKSVYFPVESLVGLGHFNRTGALVRGMVEEGYNVTVASGTFVDPKRFFAGARLVEIPQYIFENNSGRCYKIDANGQRTILPNFNMAAHAEQRILAHKKAIEELKPDIVFSEFWPFDREQLDEEMINILTSSKEVNSDRKAVVSVRDVMDVPQNDEIQSEEYILAQQQRQEWSTQFINNHFHKVLVHGDPKFINLKDTFSAATNITSDVIYTGYVLNDVPTWSSMNSSNTDAPFMVSCGSGVDGQEMIYAFLTAWEKLLNQRAGNNDLSFMLDRPLHIICGPRFAPAAYNNVQHWAGELEEEYGQNIIVEQYRTDYTNLLSQAAFSVSLAGYNTTLETLAVGVPALFVPKYATSFGKIRWSTEQLYRLECLQAKQLASYVHPKTVQDADQFAAILTEEFSKQHSCHDRLNLDFSGVETSVSAINSLYSPPRPI